MLFADADGATRIDDLEKLEAEVRGGERGEGGRQRGGEEGEEGGGVTKHCRRWWLVMKVQCDAMPGNERWIL